MATVKERFKEKYGDKEIRLPSAILTIKDDYASPLCSGSNGHLTKVRLREGKFEFYHDWWAYGWLTTEEIKKDYPCAACKLDDTINSLV